MSGAEEVEPVPYPWVGVKVGDTIKVTTGKAVVEQVWHNGIRVLPEQGGRMYLQTKPAYESDYVL